MKQRDMEQREKRKNALIKKILEIDSETELAEVEKALRVVWVQDEKLMKYIKPARKKIDLEEMVKEQNYKPIDRKVFFEKLDALQIEEPLEDLLNMLTP